MQNLGKLLRDSLDNSHIPDFEVLERSYEAERMVILINNDVINNMIRHKKFAMDQLEIQPSRELAEVEILLSLSPSNRFPISGFPQLFPQEAHSKSMISPKIFPAMSCQTNFSLVDRRRSATSSSRRYGRQRSLRKAWEGVPPELQVGAGTIKEYSAPEYTLETPGFDSHNHRVLSWLMPNQLETIAGTEASYFPLVELETTAMRSELDGT